METIFYTKQSEIARLFYRNKRSTVFAIESANIVGYQEIDVPTGFSLFTVTFNDVTGGKYDVQDITPVNADGTVVTAGKVSIQKMDNEGTYLQQYLHRSNKGGWCKGLTLQERGSITFDNGEAVCVYNNSGSSIKMRVSGEVNLEPWSMTIGAGFSLIGNMTPVELDIQNITPYDMDGTVVAAGKVSIQKMDNEGTYLQQYLHRSNKGGWCKGLTLLGDGVLTFKPGESACVYNNTGAAIQLKYKSPVAAE